MLLHSYVNKQLIVFADNLNMASLNHNEDAIHDLRVALKQVFAVRNILKQSVLDYEHSFKPRFHLVKTLFKTAGIIRDRQIMMHLAQERLMHNEYVNYRRKCNRMIKPAFLKLQEIGESQNLKKEIRYITRIFYALDILRPEFVINIFIKRISENEKQIKEQQNKANANYHLIRRLIKEQYYLLSILKEVYKYNSDENQIAKKKEMGSKLGDWHDLRVFHHDLIHSKMTVNPNTVTSIETEAKSFLNSIIPQL
ncbi:CHAD domain-containing protein [Plebeiibacterium sediminum]|uniref:CHAD domain-containing protein n=1 Tax=Plebeiibacterium sediminum TaxID=2992112 RepID=A0AAE3SEL6_9BACT|nr:CHAD domain-containing protein [Plebeiobacterium sediminum]MCW3786346.1 CHAD domain-containing protein [Plebeiobacterium sediminum]